MNSCIFFCVFLCCSGLIRNSANSPVDLAGWQMQVLSQQEYFLHSSFILSAHPFKRQSHWFFFSLKPTEWCSQCHGSDPQWVHTCFYCSFYWHFRSNHVCIFKHSDVSPNQTFVMKDHKLVRLVILFQSLQGFLSWDSVQGLRNHMLVKGSAKGLQ